MNVFTRPRQWNPAKNTLDVEKFFSIMDTCNHKIMFRILYILDETLAKMICSGSTSEMETVFESSELCYLVQAYETRIGWDTHTDSKRAKELLYKYCNITITAILNEYKKGNEVLFPEYNIQS